MGGDIAPAARVGVTAHAVEQPVERAAESRAALFHILARIAVAHRNAADRDQIVRAPLTVDIGFGRTERSAQGHRPVEAGVVDVHGRLKRVVGCAELMGLALFDDADKPGAERAEFGEDESARQVIPAARARGRAVRGGADEGVGGLAGGRISSGYGHRAVSACNDFGWG